MTIFKQPKKIRVYPNPISAQSLLSIPSDKAAVSEVELYDSFGKLIARETVNLIQGKNQIELGALLNEAQATGLYHLRVITGETVQTVRLMKP